MSEVLEETINRVRQGPFDLRAAHAIGFLAGTLLKILDQRLEERLAHLEAVLDDLAQEGRTHEDRAQELTEEKLRPKVMEDEHKARQRLFVLQIVQPGLAGLMVCRYRRWRHADRWLLRWTGRVIFGLDTLYDH